MLLLMVARGGWVNTIHGNLEFLDDDQARWLARVQSLYEPLQAVGRTKSFGGIPGDVQPYGFGSFDSAGAIYTVVNPTQAIQEIQLPLLSRVQQALRGGSVIFRDAGYRPVLESSRIKLGPGQMAAVGYGRYAAKENDLGVQEDVRIPQSIAAIDVPFEAKDKNMIEASLAPPAQGDVRIIFQQKTVGGAIMRSWPGGPPKGTSVGKVLRIMAEQNGKPLPIEVTYDKVIWSGLSWGAGEIHHSDFIADRPILVRCFSAEKDPVRLEGWVYRVEY
jgi:hypothetical protein